MRKYLLAALLFAAAMPCVADQQKSIADVYREANQFLRKKDYKDAETAYTRAIEMNQSYETFFYGRAEARFGRRDWDGVLADTAKALALNPKSPKAYKALCLRGEVFAEKKDFKSALGEFGRAIAMKPGSAEAYAGLADVYSKKDYSGNRRIQKALANYTEAIRLDSAEDRYYVLRSKAYFAESLYKESIADYDQAIRLNPRNDDAFAGRGVSRFVLSDYRAALGDFRRAIEINPGLKTILENFIEQAERMTS